MTDLVHLNRATVQVEHVHLAALVYEPTVPRDLVVVLAHGYTGSKETMDVPAGYLCSRGWPCVTFDFRGHKLGGSTGAMLHASDGLEDLRAIIGFARQRLGQERVVLVGHSFGGAVALAAVTEEESIAGVSVLGTGLSSYHGFDTPAGETLMALRGDYVVGAPAAAILTESSALPLPERSDVPALFVAARGDILVRPERVRLLAEHYGPSARTIVVDGSHAELPVRARGHLATWLDNVSA